MPTSRLLLRPQEAANSLGVSLRSLMMWVADGSVPHVRLGNRCLRFSVVDLQSWIRERSTRRPAADQDGGSDASTPAFTSNDH
ncbi:MAG: helix-turn-helix transcriptional regulator [Thermoguttaceae bacterium]